MILYRSITALISVVLLVVPSALKADELRLDHVEHLSVEDGLAHNLVWDIEQDRTGFLWIGTNNGLQRFDGYEIVTYKNDSDDPDSLAHNWVRQVFEDRAGVLWVATYGGGLERFDRAQQQFVHHQHDPGDPNSLADDRVRVVYEDADGILWVGGVNALHHFDRRDATFTRYQHDPDHPASWNPVTVNTVLVDRRGELWVGTEKGIYRSAVGTGGLVRGDFIHHRHDPADASSLSHDRVRAIHEDRQGRIWLGTEGGLDRFEPATGTFVRLRHDSTEPPERRPDLVRAIFEGTSGGLWVGTEGGGLLHRAAESELFRRYQADPEDPNGLSSSSIFSIHQDRTGVLWLGSRAGLDKIDRRRERFQVLRRRPAELGGLSGNMVWGFTEDRNGTLWVGTRDGGLAAVDRAAGTAVHYRSDPEDPKSLPHDYVSDVVEDPQGQLWIGTEGGLCRVDQDADALFHYRHDPTYPQGLRSDRIYSLLADSRGSVWIATRSSGIQRVDPPTAERPRERFVTYLHDPDDVATMSADEAYGFYEDRAGEIWVASVSGLNRFDRASETFERIQHDPTDPNSLSSTDITSLIEDEDGIFWIGTYGGGVNRWDRERGEFRHYREKDGLPSDNVSSLLLDDLGQLWIAAGPGLTRFDPRDESFRYYNKEDGLHGESFAIGSAMKSATGELIFGGPGGITTFFPEDIIDDPEPPAVVFTDFRLAGETAPLVRREPSSPLAAAVTHAEEIVLTHEHKVFAFEFAALHFSSPHQHQYAYRLEGFDDHWITTEASKRYAQYTNLDPGRYVFRVKASNQDGVWNEEGAAIAVVVRPPPWLSWWALSFYGVVLLLLARFYRRSHGRQLDRERAATERERQAALLERQAAARERETSARLREIDKLKDEFLANTSHELRTPLYGIIGLAESLIDDANGEISARARSDLTLLVASGRRLAVLVHDILDFSKLRHEGLRLHRRSLDLRTLTDVVLTFSRPLVGTKDLELQNAVPADLPAVDADEDRLQQILYNLVGNAVKFTEAGRVEVTARLLGDEIDVSVADTGIGISEEQQERIFDAFEQADASVEREYGGTGLGLAVTRRLVDLHGGTLSVESSLGAGSTFRFTLPVAASAASDSGEALIARLPIAGEADALSAETVSAEPGSAPRADAPSILIVDDEPVIRRVLVNQLAAEGYRIQSAESGPEALGRIADACPDLVLLDVMMPRVSGYEVCRTLRERHALEELPVIFLTAKNQIDDLVVGLAAGANDYLPKPIAKRELLSRVKTHLDLLSVHRQLQGMVEERTARLEERGELLRERERLIRQLEAKYAELAHFNYTVAHDLKNPLVTIKNFLGILRENVLTGRADHFEEILERLDGASEQMRRLLEQLYEFSRVVVHPNVADEVDVGELSRAALQELAVDEHGIGVEIAADLPTACGDRDRLRDVFEHLLENAVKHLDPESAEEHRIEIGYRREDPDHEDSDVVYFVRDNGIGIDPRYHDKIFDLFERLEPAGNDGTGIGLALVKRIVEGHGGRVWIESEGRGHGSTFCLTLPSHPCPPS